MVKECFGPTALLRYLRHNQIHLIRLNGGRERGSEGKGEGEEEGKYT